MHERTWWPLYCTSPGCLCTTHAVYVDAGLMCLKCRRVYPWTTTRKTD